MRILLTLSLLFVVQFLYAQLVINELSNGTQGQEEYVEFLVVGNAACGECVDLRGWIFDDNGGDFATGTNVGIATGHMRFSNDPHWACVGVGSIILVYNNSDVNPLTPSDDPTDANGDCIYILPANSNLLERNTTSPVYTGTPVYTGPYQSSGSWVTTTLSNDGDSYQTRHPDSTQAIYHSISYGNNMLNPMIYFSGSGVGKVYYMGNFLNNDPFNPGNWVAANASNSQTPGAPNNAANAQWIASLNNNCTPVAPISLSINADDSATCPGDAVVLTASTGSAGTYLWNTGQTGNQITVYPQQDTVYEVSFDNGVCTATLSYAVDIVDDPNLQIVGDSSICRGESTVLAASVGSDFQWSNGGTNYYISISPNRSKLFSVTVTEGDCTFTDSVLVHVDTIGYEISIDTPTCQNTPDGAIDITITGGNGPFSFQWFDGDNSLSKNNLLPGTYQATISDAGGCSESLNINVFDPGTLNIFASVNDASCWNTNDGSIYLGFQPAYNFAWSNGDTSISQYNLYPNTYSLTVTDLNGCFYYYTWDVSSPPAIEISADITQVSPFGTNDGSIDLTVTGVAPFTYVWSNGLNTEDLSTLSTGVYLVTVTDNNGCVLDSSFLVSQLSPCPDVDTIWTEKLTENSVKLKWPVDTNAYTYLVRGKKPNSSSWKSLNIQTTDIDGKKVSGLSSSTEYVWQIRKVCDTDSGIYTSNWSFVDTFTTRCLIPDSLFADNITATSVRLNWSHVPGNNGYEILGRKAGTSNWVSINVNQGNTSKVVNGLQPNFSYEWKIRTWCDADRTLSSLYSDTDAFTSLSNSQTERTTTVQSDILIFPNPAHDQINIALPFIDEIWTLKITGVDGRVWIQETYSNPNVILDMSNITPGVYTIQIISSEASVHQQVIKLD